MPGVGVENTKGSAFAYQGLGFFCIALVFVGDQPQRRLAFCNWFGVNPEPDLLVRPVIGRRQQRIIAIDEMRIVRPDLKPGYLARWLRGRKWMWSVRNHFCAN